MIEIQVPGAPLLRLEHLVMDYNGTLACDGHVVPGVKALLQALQERIALHVVTADTFGRVREGLRGLNCELAILPPGNQDVGKLEVITRLGRQATVCVGNGRNDRLMLKEAALGIAVMLEEGIAAEALLAADLVCRDILSALALLLHPLRLVATLRI